TIDVYTDAAWRSTDKVAGCGLHYTDPDTCSRHQGTSSEAFVVSTLMAEAIAVREALLQARTLHLSKICIKSDNQVLINALISKNHPVELYGINLDIETLYSAFSLVMFVFIPRSLNSTAVG
ncbi:unnamed protein product, partial [Brassica oleracea]